MTDDVGRVLPHGTGTPVSIPGPHPAGGAGPGQRRLDWDGPADRGDRRRAARHRSRPPGADVSGVRLGDRASRADRQPQHAAPGMVAALENLIDLERGRGAFDASLDTPTLAFAIVRVADGFLNSDVIADRASGIGRAVIVVEGLIRGLDLVQRTP